MDTALLHQIDSDKFRLLLQSIFEDRRSRNPAYSLRSFAGHLGVHAACMSVILRGKRPLTTKLIERFMGKLSLGPEDIQACLQEKRKTKTQKTKVLTLDIFAILSQWYHDAILDLMKLEDFVPDIHWIADALEISPTEVHAAVERLERCEFIEIKERNWRLLEPRSDIFVDTMTTPALKKLQKDILRMSMERIETCSIERRYHASMTIAINSKDIPKAKALLRNFREMFCKELETAEHLDDVYEFHLGFFPLTNLSKR